MTWLRKTSRPKNYNRSQRDQALRTGFSLVAALSLTTAGPLSVDRYICSACGGGGETGPASWKGRFVGIRRAATAIAKVTTKNRAR